MRRGEIWWASVDKRRPVIVIQANSFNESRLNSVVVAAITSNLRLSEMPGNVRLGRRESGLAEPSVVNVTQIFTLHRERLTQCVKLLPAQTMERVDEGIKLVLGLSG
jgi:mRNA interferase MazF